MARRVKGVETISAKKTEIIPNTAIGYSTLSTTITGSSSTAIGISGITSTGTPGYYTYTPLPGTFGGSSISTITAITPYVGHTYVNGDVLKVYNGEMYVDVEIVDPNAPKPTEEEKVLKLIKEEIYG